jgi:hypothetical protein
VTRAAGRGNGRTLAVPLVLTAAGFVVLFAGGHRVETGWPGAGGHPWRLGGLVPAPAARFGWAETLALTAYWAHPGDLLALPRAELVWTVLSPLAALSTVVGSTRLVRHTDWSTTALRYQRRLAGTAALGMTAALSAAAWWVVSSRNDPSGVYRAGSLDLALIALMAAALYAAAAGARGLSAPAP